MNSDISKTILLVEDEAIISIVISNILKRFGYKVVSANSGERAVEIAVSNETIDLILMDIELGSGIDGTEAAQRILSSRNIPIVFHTSHSEREMVERVRGITRYGYVIKSSGDFVLQSSIEMAFELVEAHKKIKEKEEHFYNMFDRAPLGYQSLDEDGRFIEVNRKWLETLGYSREEVLGRWFGDFLAPEYVDVFRGRFPMFKKAGMIHSEFKMIHKNGERRYIAFDGRIGYKDDGSFKQTHCILSDITERKVAEEALELSESRLREAQEIARIGNWEYNIDTGRVWASEKVFELFALAPSANSDIDINEFEACMRDRERVRNELAELINNDKPYNIEIEVNTPDGNPPRMLHSIAHCVRDANGRALRVTGIMQDITDRRHAESVLERSEKLLRATQQLTGIGSWEWDVNNQTMFWTEETYRIHEIDRAGLHLGEESIARSLECYRPEDRPVILAAYEKCVATGEPYDLEFRFTTCGGRQLWIRTSAEALMENGRVARVSGFIMDITGRKLAEEEINSKNEKLTEANEELQSALEEMEAANEELNATNERLAERELQVERSEEKFRGMFFQHHAVMLLIDPESGCIVDANTAAEQFYGYEPGRFRNMRIQDLNTLSPEEIADEMRRAKEDSRNHFIFPHRLANSEIRTVEVYSSPVMINGNKLLFSIIHDISESKLLEEKLRKSDELYALALAAVDDGIWEWNIPDGSAFFSSQYYNLLGYQEGEFTACYESWRLLVHPEDIDRVENDLKTGIENCSKLNIDLRMKMKSGEFLWVCIRGKAVDRDAGGRAVRMTGTLSDVTRRKKAELNLRENQAVLKRIIDNSSELICEIDSKGFYTFINGRYKDLLGYDEEELLGRHVSEKMHPDDFSAALKKQKLHKSDPGISVDEWRFMHKNGSYLTFECHGSVYTGDDGARMSVYVSHDITVSKQIENTQLFLIVSGSPLAGGDFFQSLAKYLAESLNMDYVCIDRLVGEGLSARTVAVYYDGEFEDNVEYALKDTPCGDVVGKTVCTFDRDVCGLFPHDAVLQEMKAESYAGVTLWSSKGDPIGLIAVIGRKKMENKHLAESILQIVAIRAAGELESRDAEERIKNLLMEKDILLKEVHHRIKNNMNTVKGLLFLQAEAVEDQASADALNDAISRVESMMLLYDKLYRSDNYKEAPVKEYIPVLISEIIDNFPNRETVVTEFYVGDYILDVKILVPLGIIINEIITNMMKYAFRGRDGGSIKVTSSITGNHVIFIVEDNGVGIPEEVDLINSTGFGMQLISMLADQIGGSLRIERVKGTRFLLEFDV